MGELHINYSIQLPPSDESIAIMDEERRKKMRLTIEGIKKSINLSKGDHKYSWKLRVTYDTIIEGNANSVVEFWDGVLEAKKKSIFRGDDIYAKNEEEDLRTNVEPHLYLPYDESLPEGLYEIYIYTQTINEEDFEDLLEESAKKLKEERTLAHEKLLDLEKDILVKFTHSSLYQEGSTITLEEIEFLSKVLVRNTDTIDPIGNHRLDTDGKQPFFTTTEVERLEALNHIAINQRILGSLIKSSEPLSKANILDLHKQLMKGLLVNEAEGVAGEYRKVGIKIHNSNVARPHSSQVPKLMDDWYKEIATPSEEESFISYLSRIHQRFQFIHPFTYQSDY